MLLASSKTILCDTDNSSIAVFKRSLGLKIVNYVGSGMVGKAKSLLLAHAYKK